jgi:sugar-phosphatase
MTATDIRTLDAAAFLFDLDGTLVDSRQSVHTTWARWCSLRGVSLDEVLAEMPGRTAPEVIRAVAPDLPPELVAADTVELLDWQVRNLDGTLPIAGAAELLAALPASAWAVVTACDDRLATARLGAAGLPIPDVLISADAVARGKPDPAGYELAAAKLGVPAAACVVFEDAPAGVAAGTAAGARVVALTTSVSADRLAGASVLVDDLAGVRVARAGDAWRLTIRQLHSSAMNC